MCINTSWITIEYYPHKLSLLLVWKLFKQDTDTLLITRKKADQLASSISAILPWLMSFKQNISKS